MHPLSFPCSWLLAREAQAAVLTKARDEMQARAVHVRGISCVAHKLKHEAEMKAIRKKLAELDKLEKSKARCLGRLERGPNQSECGAV